ncbi:unnamed protein product [Sphenostylis stenocarpa]|uniref:Uncharacterized protein n=1 Tax=Sphenostylis stenocarpa TaxID=92480 RepID=A0AA86VA79_9FABA|nr:unnamed protein product [Sphenostylis stenocarpa]
MEIVIPDEWNFRRFPNQNRMQLDPAENLESDTNAFVEHLFPGLEYVITGLSLALAIQDFLSSTSSKACADCVATAREKCSESSDNMGVVPFAYLRKVSEEEAKKFLSCFKRSEYDIVEQLEKMPSKISSLCCLPLKATCPNLVGSILATNYITFTDEEMTPDGTGHIFQESLPPRGRNSYYHTLIQSLLTFGLIGLPIAFGEVTRSPLSSAFETAAAASSEPRPSGLSGFLCERDKDIPRLTDFLFENREPLEAKEVIKLHSYSLAIGSTKAIGAKPTLVSLVSTIIPFHINQANYLVPILFFESCPLPVPSS